MKTAQHGRVSFRLFATLALLTIVLCAQRDNPFDPLSELFLAQPPTLQLDVTIADSSHILKQSNDTIYAFAPFSLALLATTENENNTNQDSIKILFEHLLNDSVVEQKFGVNTLQLDLKDSGMHQLIISAKGSNKLTATQTITVQLTLATQPTIATFRCNKDTLPAFEWYDAEFFLEITDTAFLAESIRINIPPFDPVTIHLTHHSNATLFDTVPFLLYSTADHASLEATALLFDQLGRIDTITTDIYFDAKNTEPPGISPYFKAINITPDTASVFQTIYFKVNARDPDGYIKRYHWNFGDGSTSDSSHTIHTYELPDTYLVTIVIEDNSGMKNEATEKVVVLPRNEAPVIKSFELTPDSGSSPLTVTMAAAAFDKDGSVEKFIFDYEFGKVTLESDFRVAQTIVYKNPGNYSVRLIVTDNKNASDTAFGMVKVE